VNQCKVNIESIGDRSDTESENDGINASSKIFGYRFAPPASGLTTHDCCQLGICSRMYLRIAGSANRLSTGMSKKPWRNSQLSQRIKMKTPEFATRANPS
jgi:hypothetical protein